MKKSNRVSPCNRALFLNGINHAKFRKLRLKLIYKKWGCLQLKSKLKVSHLKQKTLTVKSARNLPQSFVTVLSDVHQAATGHSSQESLAESDSDHVGHKESSVNFAVLEECLEDNVDGQINCNMELDDQDTLITQADPSNCETNCDDELEFCSAMEEVFNAITRAKAQLQHVPDSPSLGTSRDRILVQARLISEFAGQVSKLAGTELARDDSKPEPQRSQSGADKENMFTPRRTRNSLMCNKTQSKPHSMFPTPDSSVCNEEIDPNLTSCDVCLKEFDTHQKLKRHKKESKCAGVPWPCPECDKSFVSLRSYRGHRLKVHQINFNLKDCQQGMEFVTSTPMNVNHVTEDTESVSETSSLSVEDLFATSDNEQPLSENIQKIFRSPKTVAQTKIEWQCPQCLKFLGSKSSVNKHLRKVHNVSNHDLYEMDFITRPQTTSSTHEEPHAEPSSVNRKGELAPNDTFIHCEDCHKKFKTPHLLQKHKETGRCEKALWQCHECKQFFSTQLKVRKHLAKVHQVPKGLAEMGYVTKPADVEHETAEDQESNTSFAETGSCAVCNVEFDDPFALEVHLAAGHTLVDDEAESVSTVCDVCLRDFITFQRLTKHKVATQCAKLEWQCPKCAGFYQSRDTVSKHLRKEHKMSTKGVVFVTRPAAEDAIKSVDEETFCNSCSKDFEDTKSLQQHLKQSKCAGLELECPLCLKLYPSRHLILRHTNKIHQMVAKDYDILKSQKRSDFSVSY